MADQVLERFHRALIEEIQTQRPEYLTQPFTVAEIYQNLVPYGSHRDRIGVEMNGDYEDALVRLLAGEGGYLILDSEPALEDLRAELEAASPNTGVYREFAAVDVRLNQAYLDLSAEAMDQLPDLYEELEAEDPVAMTDLAPAEGNANATDLGVVPPGVDIFADGSVADAGAPPEPGEEREIVSAGDMSDSRMSNGSRTAEAEGEHVTEEAEFEPTGPEVYESVPLTPTIEAAEVGGGEEPASEDDRDEGSTAERRAARPPLEPEFVEEPAEPRKAGGGAEPAVQRVGSAPGEPCLWCRADLPERETLNFCPYCGTDVHVVPCPRCGDEVEPSWRFCASCGTEVDA